MTYKPIAIVGFFLAGSAGLSCANADPEPGQTAARIALLTAAVREIHQERFSEAAKFTVDPVAEDVKRETLIEVARVHSVEAIPLEDIKNCPPAGTCDLGGVGAHYRVWEFQLDQGNATLLLLVLFPRPSNPLLELGMEWYRIRATRDGGEWTVVDKQLVGTT